jgi:hypothetical protein
LVDGNVPSFVFDDSGYVPPPGESAKTGFSRFLTFVGKCRLPEGINARTLFIAYLALSGKALANPVDIGTQKHQQQFACPSAQQIAKWENQTEIGVAGRFLQICK